jgi:trigger factor
LYFLFVLHIVVTEEVLDEQLNMVAQANQMTKEQVLEKIDLEGFKRDLSRMQASRIIVNNAVEK